MADAMESSDAVTSPSAVQRANLDLVVQAGTLIRTSFAWSQEDLFARDFVFHFVNPNLEDLHGLVKSLEEPAEDARHGDRLVAGWRSERDDTEGRSDPLTCRRYTPVLSRLRRSASARTAVELR